LLGTTYGGDGKSTFALPNLQGSAPMQPGQGPGLTDRFLGEQDGSPTIVLLQSEIPQHSHALNTSNDEANNANPVSRYFGRGNALYAHPANLATMAPGVLGPAGGGQPHNNMQPYLTFNFCIAIQGIFPSRP
jgi:microcystin-dependent protein